MKSLTQLYDPATFRRQGHSLVDLLADYLKSTPEAVANPHAEPGDMLEGFRTLLKEGTTPDDLFKKVLTDSVHLHSPYYMGHQMNPPAPLVALADLLNGIINGSTAIFEMGRAGAVMERLVIEHTAGLLQLSKGTSGFLTNGGTLANLTALLAARAAKWPSGDAWKDGNGDLRPCVFVNEQAHYCIDRAVRIMGWGEAGVVNIPSDDKFRMRTELLEEAISTARSKGMTPLAIIGSAGTTSTGSFDDLGAIADFAERHGLWFHIDGAHGAPVRLDPEKAHQLNGLERADSMIMDYHKMMMCPGLTTGVFFRNGTDAFRTFHQQADYLLSFDTNEEDWYNMGRRTFECTKNMMSLRVFSLLSCYGSDIFRDYVVRVNTIAANFAADVRANPLFELALDPGCNIVCFRYRPTMPVHSADDLDNLNAMIRAQLVAETNYYLVQTRLRSRIYLRCTFTNPKTEVNHTAGLLQAIQSIGGEITNLRSQFLT
ncbi:pyridoxal phosphate-dependent decarboxylase family protein [Neolewinella persica]|uniref:pyridoxal phosphate-dependent decarboxylase family protein n=1 Tax=Neolewinella persica TaxID=70998 RepID=UPI0005C475C7|nr:pyridoxal-dependent decarboxylase [Neolewinella persica]